MPHARHGFKRFKRLRNQASVQSYNHLRKSFKSFGFHGNESAGSNDLGNLFDAESGHGFRRIRLGKKGRGDGVYAGVRALRRQDYGAEQGKGAMMVQRDGNLRIQVLEVLDEVVRFLLLGHGTKVETPALSLTYLISKLMTHLNPGDLAPQFEAQDQHGATVTLKQFAGKKVVLYFYPKDDTPGCTAEACSFRDGQSELQNAGYTVLGVSPDSVKSHGKFADKFSLNFSLLADTEKTICQAYGVWGPKKFMGREYDGVNRETFVISEDGHVERVIAKVDTKEASKQILAGV